MDVVHADDPAPLQHDRVLDLGVAQLAVGADRGVRADVGVDEHAFPAPMIAGPRTIDASSRAPASITTAPLDARFGVELDRRCGAAIVSSTRRLQCSSGSFLPVSIHQPSSTSCITG